MCHLIVPQKCGVQDSQKKNVFRKVHGQFKERMIGLHNPESGFREKCEVFGNYLLPSPRMCHLIVPKICGTPGFTEKNVFRRVFKSDLKKEFANTILNPVFVKSARFLDIFRRNRPECAI